MTDLAGDEAVDRAPFETDWKRRRRAVILTEIFCGSIIAYLTVWGDADSRLHETIVNGAWLTGASVLLGYLGFPVLDAQFRNRAVVSMAAVRSGRPAAPANTGRVDEPR